jgi:hypothetical protein
MQNISYLLKELGNYLISVCDKNKQEYYYNIKGSLIDLPEYIIPQVLSTLRPENENENQIVIENGVEVVKKSQLNEWAFIYGLDLSNEEVKNNLNNYLNELLMYK